MKKLLLVGLFLLSSFSFAGSGTEEMRLLLSLQEDRYLTYLSDEAKARGFDIKDTKKPFIKKEHTEFRNFLEKNEKEQQALFNEVVDSGEYDSFGKDRAEIKAQAKRILDVKFLFEIEECYEVTKDGETIGYIFSISEHGQGAVIQDGAWSEVYVDKDFKVLFRNQETA